MRAGAIEIPCLKPSVTRRDQKVSFSIPVRPLDVTQQLKRVSRFERVAEPHAIYGLIDAVRGAGPTEALDAQHAAAPGLTLLHAGVPPLVPGVAGNPVGRLRGFRPPAPPFVCELDHWNGAKAFFEKLVARGKTPRQAYVAVMRKLLHAIYGMLATQTDFVGEKFHATA
jgi:hypothetical protein